MHTSASIPPHVPVPCQIYYLRAKLFITHPSPPQTAVHLQKLTNGSKSQTHHQTNTMWQGKREICSPYRLTRVQNTTPSPPLPCFCSLQKWAVKDQQYSLLREEDKGSCMQIFWVGRWGMEGAKQAQCQRSHLWDLGMSWEIKEGSFLSSLQPSLLSCVANLPCFTLQPAKPCQASLQRFSSQKHQVPQLLS